MARECSAALIECVLTAATAVHRAMGPGLLESVYEAALVYELQSAGIAVEAQVPIPVVYRNVELGIGFRLDLLVELVLVLEIKSLSKLDSSHITQLLTYLRFSNLSTGFILNFNHRLLKQGIKRVSLFSSTP